MSKENRIIRGGLKPFALWGLVSLGILFIALIFNLDIFFWQRYYNQEYQFSLLLPSQWEKGANATYGAVVFASEPQKGQDDNFRENINLNATEFDNIVSLVTFFELNKEDLFGKLVPLGVSEGDISAGLLPGKWLSFQSQMKGIKVKILIAIFVKDNRAYTITCTSEITQYPKYEPIFMKIIRSLRIG